MRSRRIHFAIFCSMVSLTACDASSPSLTTPLAPSAASLPPSPPPSNVANWRADATVLSVTNPGGGCRLGTSVGDTWTGVEWRTTITGDSILLDEDMRNWPSDHIPFSGTLSSHQFTATYTSGDDYLRYVCQFKGATLNGSFSEDFSSFEALETLVWGPPEGEPTMQRRWVGSRF